MLNNNSKNALVKKRPKLGRLLLATASLMSPLIAGAADTRPNIILLVADDAGYSDFSVFGGEAKTPTMDSLASIGKTLTNFHAMPTCSPARAVFLTGIDNHINGLGTMQGQLRNPTNIQKHTPGYQGFVNEQSLMISTLLKDADYHTYMVGKWHLAEEGEVDNQTVFLRGTWPIDRGFERSFGILNGGGDHFSACERMEGTCTRFFENEEILLPTFDFPVDYFSATIHTDKAIEFIDADKSADAERKPFFLYYADTMPHEPNQLPADFLKQEYIDMYYQQGWDGIRVQRFEKMKELGIIPSDLPFPDRVANYPEWNDDSDPNWQPLLAKVTEPPYNVIWGDITTVDDLKHTLAKKMALYTGMVEFFDAEVARMITHLKSVGEYDNTVFIYFSDNGGDGRDWDWVDRDALVHRGADNSFDNIGNAGSFVANGPQWAQVTNAPLYASKVTMAEGGIRVPLVIAYPNGSIDAGSHNNKMVTAADLAATVLDYATVQHPVGTGVTPDWDNCTGNYAGKSDICPMNGKSLRSVLNGSTQSIHASEPIGFEIFGQVRRVDGEVIGEAPNKALFYEEDGQLWKILRLGNFGWGAGVNEPWRLYNLDEDISEANDLGTERPEKLAQLMTMYNEYEQNVGVIPQNAKKQTGVIPGVEVLHSFTLTNRDDSSETYHLSCRSDWPCALPVTSFTLEAGSSININAYVDVPANAANQTHTTQVVISRSNKPAMSTNQILVTQTSETAVVADYDRVMDWAEVSVAPELLAGSYQVMQIDGYKVRYYSETDTYLGYKPADNNMYIYNYALYGSNIELLGSLDEFLPQAIEAGF